MKKGVILLMCMAVLVFFAPSKLRAADDSEQAAKAFQEMSDALQKEPNLSPETKEKIKNFGEAVLKMKGPQAAPGAQGKIADWFADEKNAKKFTDFFGGPDGKGFIDRISLNGDFRLRFENTTNAGSTKGDPAHRDQARYRARLRFGAEYEVTPTAWIGARLVTGPRNEQQSANQTLGDDFSKWEVNFDRIYLHWAPYAQSPYKLCPTTTYEPHLWLGKFAHPFKSTSLMWYSDVQPEGMALINSFKNVGGFLDEVQLNVATYFLTEDADQQDAWIGAAQLMATKKFDVGLPDKVQLTLAEAFYNIKDTANNDNKSEILNNSNGNFKNPPTATAFSTLQSDYALLDSLIELKYGGIEICGRKKPLVLQFNYIHNMDANMDKVNMDGTQNNSYMFSVVLGDATKKGDWRIGGNVIHSERDGTFKPLTNADFAVVNNFNGIDLYFDYAVWNNAYMRLWALWDSPIHEFTTTFDKDGNPTYSDQIGHFRFRVEFNVKW